MTLQRSDDDFALWWLESHRRFQEVADRAFDRMMRSREERGYKPAPIKLSESVRAYINTNPFLDL